MPKFLEISNIDQLPPTATFCEGFFTHAGKAVTDNYEGRIYRLLSVTERHTPHRPFVQTALFIAAIAARILVPVFLNKPVEWGRWDTAIVVAGALLLIRLFSKALAPPTETKKYYGIESTRTKVRGGKTLFLNPEMVVPEATLKSGTFLSFGTIVNEGKKSLVPLVRKAREQGSEVYSDPCEALFHLAQQKNTAFRQVLQHPCHIDPSNEKFENYLLQNDNQGNPRILSLSEGNLVDYLQLVKVQKENLAYVSLFTLWCKKKGDDPATQQKILTLLLELNPAFIQHIKNGDESLLPALYVNNLEAAKFIHNIMAVNGIPSSPEELWFMHAAKDNPDFFDGEGFRDLPELLRQQIYYVINRCGSVKVLAKIGLRVAHRYGSGPELVARNMNILEVRASILNLLKDVSKYRNNKNFQFNFTLHHKTFEFDSADLGTLSWGSFIQTLIKKHNLHHMHVPGRVLSIDSSVNAISFTVNGMGELRNSDGLNVYSEKIQPVDRKLSLEEAIQLMTLLQLTGLNNMERVVIAKDGIYITLADSINCDPTGPSWDKILKIKVHLDAGSQEAFDLAYAILKETWDNDERKRIARFVDFQNYYNDPLNDIAKVIPTTALTFKVEELLVGVKSN